MSDIDGGTTLALSGSRGKPMLWLAGLMAIPLLLVVAFGADHAHMHGATPGNAQRIAIVLVCVVAVLILLLMSRANVRVDQGALIVNTSVGTKRIPLANLRAHGLHLVNFGTHPELRPVVKLWGTGLPGFAGGWFKLRNGDKAVCLLLDRHGIAYLRSDEDKLTLLLSLAEPEKLRALLER